MTVVRFFAVVLIFLAVSAAWGILGGVVFARTEMLDDSLSGEMASLWGPKVVTQTAPYWTAKPTGERTDAGAIGP